MVSPDNAGVAGEFDVFELLGVAWSYKYLILAGAVVGAAITTFLALTATPLFRAEAVVAEVREGGMSKASSLAGQLGGLASLAGVNLNVGGAGREAQAVLASRRLVEEFIRRQQLLPQLFPGSANTPTLWLGVQEFRKNVLVVHEDKIKGLTTISVDWTDGATAARWANGLVALANDLLRAHDIDESKRNLAYLNEQITATDTVEVRRLMYNMIENETKTLMLANGRLEYAFTIVDPAVAPEIRISPKRTLMVLTGLVLGAVLGTIAAFVRNALLRRRAGMARQAGSRT